MILSSHILRSTVLHDHHVDIHRLCNSRGHNVPVNVRQYNILFHVLLEIDGEMKEKLIFGTAKIDNDQS